jgi:hypothetical protein
MMVIKDRRQGNFETIKLCCGFGPLGAKEKLVSKFWWQL